jgi:hypothetical protein
MITDRHFLRSLVIHPSSFNIHPSSLLDPLHPPPDVLDRSILHAELDADRAMETPAERFSEDFGQRSFEQGDLLLVDRRLAERRGHHGVKNRAVVVIFQYIILCILCRLVGHTARF